jgi:hypothetical protein
LKKQGVDSRKNGQQDGVKSEGGAAMVGILVMLLVLSDAGLAKRIREAAISAALVLALVNGDLGSVTKILAL